MPDRGRIEPLHSDEPGSVAALIERARAIEGMSVAELGTSVGIGTGGDAVRTKGTAGEILERVLGARGGSQRVADFPALGVELKTIPVDDRGVPSESTYVCTLTLADAERQDWSTSWVREKLSLVLFVPLVGPPKVKWPLRRIGKARLWSPTPLQEEALRADFDDVVGLIGIGRIEDVTAHLGRFLQVRPKARHGRVRTVAWGADREAIPTVPRGFYLRTRFTGAILADPEALP